MIPATDRERTLVARASEIATQVLAPRANDVDRGLVSPMSNLRCLAEAGLLGLTVPSSQGGAEVSRSTVRECLQILSSACGVTGFLVGRHLNACRTVASSNNHMLKWSVLPEMALGNRLCAHATTHLLNSGAPSLRATPYGNGYRLDGTAPWVTGWGIMEEMVVGATLPDGNFLFGLLPLIEGPTLHVSEPMDLCAMSSTATVSVTCSELVVDSEHVLGVETPQDIRWWQNAGLLGQTIGPFAVTGASIALIEAETRENSASGSVLELTADALQAELSAAQLEVRLLGDRGGQTGFPAAARRLVAWSQGLSLRAAQAALLSVGARGISRTHTAQRLFRETMFYTIYLQNSELRAEMLQQLTRTLGHEGTGKP
jgi:alkylation response protein AidB-like acyl-CoA dehydrogenase